MPPEPIRTPMLHRFDHASTIAAMNTGNAKERLELLAADMASFEASKRRADTGARALADTWCSGHD